MTYVNIIIIDGKEVEFNSLSEDRKREVSNELNRRVAEKLGYKEIKTA